MTRKRRSGKKSENKLSTGTLQKAILQLFQEHPDKRYTARHIIEKLGINNNKDSINYALEQLELNGQLVAASNWDKTPEIVEENGAQNGALVAERSERPRRTERPDRTRKKESEHDTPRATYMGTVDMARSGAAYIVCEGLEADVYVPSKFLNGALHGDKVKVAVFTARGRKKPDGEVMKILERATEHFIGTIHLSHKYGVVLPDRPGVGDVYVELPDTMEADDGMKVIVRITKWPSRTTQNLTGVVTTVLGEPGGSDMAMKTILINNGFNITFPEAVIEESEKISEEITAEEIAKRRDFRDVTTFTIDPIDAKDFDDALSIKKLDNGNIEIGVHIADVSHYLTPHTALDKEAYLRSTSVYLVDRVCPMLPEKLSNGLCSLRPQEEKLTFSAVFELDEEGKVVDRWFGKTVIFSDRRFAYEEAQEILEAGEGDYSSELILLNQLAHKLRKKRFAHGAINFETDEVRFKLDEHGVPIEVYIKERKDAHMLVEDFMLLANKEVAGFMMKKPPPEVPFIYRVHDLPDMDKLRNFALFALELGIKIDLGTPKSIAKSINALMKKSEKDESLKLLTPLAIRCMAKADYSSNNIGHYGLAFENYSHFTSPIRRYSDVIAHRILEKNLGKAEVRVNKDDLEEQCKHISKQERKAVDAERESTKYKQVEYIKTRIGEVFDGYVSGLIERGLFIALTESQCEGMIPYERMGEPYELDPSRLKARGVRSGTIYKMGDFVKVKILGADLEKKQIEMEILSKVSVG